MRTRSLAGLVAGLVLAGTGLATADSNATLTRARPNATLSGHVEGASSYGPFYPVVGPSVSNTCVQRGCVDHTLHVEIPAGTKGNVEWSVSAPSTGPGVDLRIYDANGTQVSEPRAGGGLGPNSTATYGVARGLPPGSYRVRITVMAGAADYRASLTLLK